MHDVNDHFLSQLQQLVQHTSSNVITQRLKTHPDLFAWVIQEAPAHFDSVTSRVQWLLAGRPEVQCPHGSSRKWVSRNNQLGFCGNTKQCRCFRDQVSEQSQSNDMALVISKRKDTWRQKYGADNPSQCVEIKNKRRATMASRNYQQLRQRLKQDKQQLGFQQVVERLQEVVVPAFDVTEYQGSFRKNFYPWQCCQCGQQFWDHVDYGRVPRCVKCHPSHVSMAQLELEQWLQDQSVQFQRGNRTILGGRELDIWIPDQKLAIEFNGTYWHSDQFRDKYYHANKFQDCRNQGVRLIQIWEDEWKTKRPIVLSRLLSVLGKDQTLFARKCVIDTDIDPAEHREFLQTQHLQGYAAASVVQGLRHQGELVALMTFSLSRYALAPWELIRYASKGSVVGGASRLFQTFVQQHQPVSVVSYANRCWSWGTMYQRLGFTETTPRQINAGYWYVKNDKRYHRSSFTKKALIQQGLDAGQTEMQLMKSLGYQVIWDAGNSRWTWNR